MVRQRQSDFCFDWFIAQTHGMLKLLCSGTAAKAHAHQWQMRYVNVRVHVSPSSQGCSLTTAGQRQAFNLISW